MVEHRVGDADYLTALGMAGINLKHASAIMRFKLGGGIEDLREALATTTLLTRQLNAKNRWHCQHAALQVIAHNALSYYTNPVCPSCNGTKYKAVPGTGRLSATVCPACNGTGQHVFKKHHDQIADVVAVIEQLEHKYASAIKRMMKR